jgi:hypothetical protein
VKKAGLERAGAEKPYFPHVPGVLKSLTSISDQSRQADFISLHAPYFYFVTDKS